MHQVFICDPKAIESKINTLIKSTISVDGWSTYFEDSESEEKWLLTYYDSEYPGGGTKVLKRLPIPNTYELIKIAISTDNEDEIRCASLELLEQEKINKKDFRIDLLNTLQNFKREKLSAFDKQRIKTIITESQLTDPINRRQVIGKSHNEVLADANYFKGIADEAENILSF